MSFTHVAVRAVRNLVDMEMSPGPSVNLIYGANGSGKTSVLEAIHILGQAKSFRSPRLSPVIQNGATKFTVAGRIHPIGHAADTLLRVSYTAPEVEIYVNRERVRRVSDLVIHVPLVVINTDSHRLLDDGPRLRRRFMDWGVFHVEHAFLDVWKRYYRALRQRNALLRRRATPAQLSAWNAELAHAGEQIDRYRRQYVADLTPPFVHYVSELSELADVSIDYLRGWSSEHPLAPVLIENVLADLQAGYTTRGPHRADLVIKIAGAPAAQRVSRGQQKLLICALLLAQAALLGQKRRAACVLLVDDLPAELDPMHRNRLLSLLRSLGQQSFVTATEPDLFDRTLLVNQRLFHVEHGKVSMTALAP